MDLNSFLDARGSKDFSEFELWFLIDCIVSA